MTGDETFDDETVFVLNYLIVAQRSLADGDIDRASVEAVIGAGQALREIADQSRLANLFRLRDSGLVTGNDLDRLGATILDGYRR